MVKKGRHKNSDRGISMEEYLYELVNPSDSLEIPICVFDDEFEIAETMDISVEKAIELIEEGEVIKTVRYEDEEAEEIRSMKNENIPFTY